MPCYILYRLDSRNASGFDFAFMAWSPDFANVKDKMLYASTKATFKQTFGTRYIKEELYATEPVSLCQTLQPLGVFCRGNFCFVLFCFVLFCFVLFCFVLCAVDGGGKREGKSGLVDWLS